MGEAQRKDALGVIVVRARRDGGEDGGERMWELATCVRWRTMCLSSLHKYRQRRWTEIELDWIRRRGRRATDQRVAEASGASLSQIASLLTCGPPCLFFGLRDGVGRVVRMPRPRPREGSLTAACRSRAGKCPPRLTRHVKMLIFACFRHQRSSLLACLALRRRPSRPDPRRAARAPEPGRRAPEGRTSVIHDPIRVARPRAPRRPNFEKSRQFERKERYEPPPAPRGKAPRHRWTRAGAQHATYMYTRPRARQRDCDTFQYVPRFLAEHGTVGGRAAAGVCAGILLTSPSEPT